MDMTTLKQHLLARPWIAGVSVRRIWPDKLRIRLNEQEPVARWGETGLVNAQGEIFTPRASSIPTGLPMFRGPDDQLKAVIKNYQKMVQMLKPLHLQIDELDLTPRRSWTLVLSDGVALKLGRVDILSRLRRFVAIYPRIFNKERKNIQYVDLRYTNGVAIGEV